MNNYHSTELLYYKYEKKYKNIKIQLNIDRHYLEWVGGCNKLFNIFVAQHEYGGETINARRFYSSSGEYCHSMG